MSNIELLEKRFPLPPSSWRPWKAVKNWEKGQ